MPGRFAERYRLAAAYLFGEVGPHSGMSEAALAAGESRLRVAVPKALREYYLSVGAMPFNHAEDHLYGPDGWEIDEGHLVFLGEPQYDKVFWGVPAAGPPADDPPVFQTEPRRPAWSDRASDRCSDFLVTVMHWQGTRGGLPWCGLGSVPAAVADLSRLGWEAVGSSLDLSAFRRRELAACVLGTGPMPLLFVGALTKARFDAAATELAAAGVRLVYPVDWRFL